MSRCVTTVTGLVAGASGDTGMRDPVTSTSCKGVSLSPGGTGDCAAPRPHAPEHRITATALQNLADLPCTDFGIAAPGRRHREPEPTMAENEDRAKLWLA